MALLRPLRFGGPVSDTEEVSLPNSTKSTTDWGIRVWNESATSRSATFAGDHGIAPLTALLLEMSHVDLAYWMGKFALEVRKKDGSEYPPLVCCFKHSFEQQCA